MRKTINVCGIGHKTGTNRQGKNYDFYEIHYTYNDDIIEGVGCGNIIVPDDIASAVSGGDVCDLHTHYYNGKEYFDAMFPKVQ